MPKIKTNGINIYYEVHGRGKPLVLIPGLSCDIRIWTPIIHELSTHFQVLVFDNRGAGQSDSPNFAYTIKDMANDTVGLINHLGIGLPSILGHSMGGAIAQTIAADHSDLIDKLVLANSMIKLNALNVYAQEFFLNLRRDPIPKRRIFEGFVPWIFSENFISNQRDQIEQIIDLELANPYPQTTEGFARQLEALIAFDSKTWYRNIHASTLVIHGDGDILCPNDSLILSQGIPAAKLFRFPGIGHSPMIENPDGFNRAVIDFLKS